MVTMTNPLQQHLKESIPSPQTPQDSTTGLLNATEIKNNLSDDETLIETKYDLKTIKYHNKNQFSQFEDEKNKLVQTFPLRESQRTKSLNASFFR
jgi:hypothetical protein